MILALSGPDLLSWANALSAALRSVKKASKTFYAPVLSSSFRYGAAWSLISSFILWVSLLRLLFSLARLAWLMARKTFRAKLETRDRLLGWVDGRANFCAQVNIDSPLNTVLGLSTFRLLQNRFFFSSFPFALEGFPVFPNHQNRCILLLVLGLLCIWCTQQSLQHRVKLHTPYQYYHFSVLQCVRSIGRLFNDRKQDTNMAGVLCHGLDLSVHARTLPDEAAYPYGNGNPRYKCRSGPTTSCQGLS